jgi:hypothetical protein
VVGHLPGKHEALSLNPSTVKKKEEEEEEEEEVVNAIPSAFLAPFSMKS